MDDGRDAPRVLVVGAGSAGLLTAQALKQGANVTVFEQDASPTTRPRDWNFGIYWAQVPLSECLPEQIAKEVENAQVDDHKAGPDEVMQIFNGLSEELMKAVPAPYNIRLARRRFLRLISHGLDIRYGKRLKIVSEDGSTVSATFEDGSTETGQMLIGAEGAHSLVREYLVGREKSQLQMSPLVSSFTMAKLPKEAAMKFKEITRRLMIIFHPDGYFNWIGVHDAYEGTDPGDWTFMMAASWIPSDPDYDPSSLKADQILPDLKTRAKVFGPTFRYLWESIPDDTRCWHNRLSYWVPEPFGNENSRVTVVGDAAHPMTFHRGQGLNNAIYDVALLAQKTREHGFNAAAIKAYQTDMLPRAREAVISSNKNSEGTHNWDTLLQSPLFTTGVKQK